MAMASPLRPMPQDLEAERLVLASVLDGQLQPAILAGLRTEHFSSNEYRYIYAAVLELTVAGSPTDIVSVARWLREHDRGVASERLANLADAPAATGPHLLHHVEVVVNRAGARTFIAHCQRFAAQGHADPGIYPKLLDEARETLTSLVRTGTATRFAPMAPAFLLEPDPAVAWLVAELGISPGPPVMFAGYGYSGKTAAAQALALAVASGTRAWGWFQCRQGRTLHLDYEQGMFLTKKRYRRLATGNAIDIRECANNLGFLSFPSLYLDNTEAESELCRACDGAALLIVDSLRACAPSLDENSSEVRRALDMLTRVSEKTGVVPLIIHHARKPSKDDPPGARYGIRGSAAIFDACASVFVLVGDKDDAKRVVHEKDRMRGQTHEDFFLAVEDVEIEGDPKAGLRVAARTEDVAKPKAAPSALWAALVAKVLDHIIHNPGVAGKGRLAQQTGMRRSSVFEAVDELIEQGKVENRPQGKPAKPRLYAVGPTSIETERTPA